MVNMAVLGEWLDSKVFPTILDPVILWFYCDAFFEQSTVLSSGKKPHCEKAEPGHEATSP